MDKSDGLEETGTLHIYYVVQKDDFLNLRPGWEQGYKGWCAGMEIEINLKFA